ncbi:unnamed protein product [Toxocara canis]|uniref:ARID domain-containing protein n=1 Tax=Toxocara canis TaxID=6265 RepID=A0A3P7ERH0_TOXCA|nr:unnamed protein product [Toxocara canis]
MLPHRIWGFPQPSPIPNGSYGSPGSAGPPGGKAKAKPGSRPASRDVVFPPSAGQGGPPPQMPPMQNPAVMGLRMDGPPASPASPAHGFSSPEMTQAQHAVAVAAQQQMQQASQQQIAAMQQQQHPGYPPGMYPPGYWPPQQPRYPMQPTGAPPAHYYHHPVQPQVPHSEMFAVDMRKRSEREYLNEAFCFSAFSGYSIPPNRPMMPTGGKMPQTTQMEMPRMPNGPSAADWQAKMNATKVPSQEPLMAQVAPAVSTSSGNVPAQSPGGASSAADESLDDSKSMRGGSPASWPHTPAQLSQGQRTPVPPGQPSTPGMIGSTKLKDSTSIVDKLVGPVSSQNPQHVMADRRAFFEKLVLFCERQGEPITQVPQVSKQTVDLHRLYIAVMKRGGFEQVTREKTWKHVCTEANSEMSESSAAGYQLRRHYQKYLLGLECFETGKNLSEMVAFAEKLKKRRRAADKDHQHQQQQQYPGPGSLFTCLPLLFRLITIECNHQLAREI